MSNQTTQQNRTYARPQAQQGSITRTMPSGITPGTFSGADRARLTTALKAASEEAHLVAPGAGSASMPEGVDVAITAFFVDQSDTYPIPGGATRGLGRATLDKIWQAAGGEWDINASHVVPHSHPYVYEFVAVGAVRQLDGRLVPLMPGRKKLDLRDSGARRADILRACAAKLAKARKEDRETQKHGGRYAELTDEQISARAEEAARVQISVERQNIEALCQTKARLRVIRQLVKGTYTDAELAKPFVVAKASWTGYSDDPEVRRDNARAIREAFYASGTKLFGASSLPAPTHIDSTIEDVDVDEDLFDLDLDSLEDDSLRGGGSAGGSNRPVDVIRFGDAKGTRFAEAEERSLRWYRGAIEKDLSDPSKANYHADTKRQIEALDAELARRAVPEEKL